MFQIEKNVPMPSDSHIRRMESKTPRSKYPFPAMKPGDSFRVTPAKKPATSVAATLFSKKYGGKFTMRRVGAAYRCWRVG